MAGATIVVCDVVGFSEYSNEEQRDLICDLGAEVTHELYRDLAGIEYPPDVISLPTGDGVAIAFMDKKDPKFSWRPTLFSLLIRLMRWAVRKSPLRIGVHVGQVSVISDINRRPNVCGNTINVCQRIMDAAHPNQVLFSQNAVTDYVGRRQMRSGVARSDREPIFQGPINITAKHGLSIPVYVMSQPGEPGWVETEPFPSGVLHGKLERTAFIVENLKALHRDKKRRLQICEQSGFSTFGIRGSAIDGSAPDQDSKYRALLQQQRSLLNELSGRATLHLIIHPVRTPDACDRLLTLVNWMTSPTIASRRAVDFVISKFEGPNRLTVADAFSIEGYKLHRTAGYEMSIVHYDKYQLGQSIAAFDRVFQEAKNSGQTKTSVVATLRGLLKDWSQQLQTKGGPIGQRMNDAAGESPTASRHKWAVVKSKPPNA